MAGVLCFWGPAPPSRAAGWQTALPSRCVEDIRVRAGDLALCAPRFPHGMESGTPVHRLWTWPGGLRHRLSPGPEPRSPQPRCDGPVPVRCGQARGRSLPPALHPRHPVFKCHLLRCPLPCPPTVLDRAMPCARQAGGGPGGLPLSGLLLFDSGSFTVRVCWALSWPGVGHWLGGPRGLYSFERNWSRQ